MPVMRPWRRHNFSCQDPVFETKSPSLSRLLTVTLPGRLFLADPSTGCGCSSPATPPSGSAVRSKPCSFPDRLPVPARPQLDLEHSRLASSLARKPERVRQEKGWHASSAGKLNGASRV